MIKNSLILLVFSISTNSFSENHSDFQSTSSAINCDSTKVMSISMGIKRSPAGNGICLDLFKSDENLQTELKKIKANSNTKNSTHSPPVWRQLFFNKMTPGKFNTYEYRYDKKTNESKPHFYSKLVVKPYELAQTQTTQLQWSVVQVLLGKTDQNVINPSYHKDGPESVEINIKDIIIKMQPNHPVEHVNYEEIKAWIIGLNKLSKEGNHEIQSELRKIIPEHKKGDIYDLPTLPQWGRAHQLVLNNKRIDNDTIDWYAWHADNADGVTHAVATRAPRTIHQKNGNSLEFYDLGSNVLEWLKEDPRDYHQDKHYEDHLLSSRYTLGSKYLRSSKIAGVPFIYSATQEAHDLRAFKQLSWPPHLKTHYLGFRLVKKSPLFGTIFENFW